MSDSFQHLFLKHDIVCASQETSREEIAKQTSSQLITLIVKQHDQGQLSHFLNGWVVVYCHSVGKLHTIKALQKPEAATIFSCVDSILTNVSLNAVAAAYHQIFSKHPTCHFYVS